MANSTRPTDWDKESEIEFGPANGGGVKATSRVLGRIAFPDRRGNQPKNGERWICRIAGENPQHSVYFLECMRFVSNPESRRQAEETQRAVDMRVWGEIRAMKPAVTEALQGFSSWLDAEPLVTVPGYGDLMVKVTWGEKRNDPVDEAGIHHQATATALWKGRSVAMVKGEVLVPWAEVEVDPDPVSGSPFRAEHNLARANVHVWLRTTVGTAWQQISCNPLRNGWAEFVGWVLKPSEILARVRVWLPNGHEKVFEVPIGTISKENEIIWAERRLWESSMSGFNNLASFVPEPGPEQIAHLTTAKAEADSATAATKAAGLLSIDGNAWYYLRDKAQMPGIGWAGCAETDPGVIDPAIAVVFEGTNVSLTPLVMRDDAPETAWEQIDWPNGRQVDPALIEKVRTETRVVIGKHGVPAGKGEHAVCKASVTAVEVGGDKGKYRYDAVIQIPHAAREERAHNYGMEPIVLRRWSEPKPQAFEGIAFGDANFNGETEVEVREITWGSNPGLHVYWTPPKSEAQVSEAEVDSMIAFIKSCQRGQLRLAGWRYTDTGNPVILYHESNNSAEWWSIWELDRQTPGLIWRKGGGSKTNVLSLTPRAIDEGLRKYASFGWPVIRDPKLPQGKLLTEVI